MIEMGKQYRTRDGREVRIYAVDGMGLYPIHGAFILNSGWYPDEWTSDGKSGDGPHLDLIEVRPTITRTYWLIHWPTQSIRAYGFETREEAERYRGSHSNLVAVTGPHVITFTEGEGLCRSEERRAGKGDRRRTKYGTAPHGQCPSRRAGLAVGGIGRRQGDQAAWERKPESEEAA